MSSDEDNNEHTVVLDNGSSTLRAGFAGSDKPLIVFPSCIGSDKHRVRMLGVGACSEIGSESQINRGIMAINYPIKRGKITDYDAMEKIWAHTFYSELKIDTLVTPVVTTHPINVSRQQVDKTSQIMFETFEMPSMFTQSSVMSTMYSSGRTTGVVVESGGGITQIVPFYEGFMLKEGAVYIDLGGADITEKLSKDLNSRGGTRFMSSSDQEIVREIKEKICYVAENYDNEKMYAPKTITKEYELPGYTTINVSSERFEAPEIMFQPHLAGMTCSSIQEATYTAIMKCNMDVRKDLWRNIVLSGSNTLMPGFVDRFKTELMALAPKKLQETPGELRICANEERACSVWIGTSIIGSLTNFAGAWTTKQFYDENGPSRSVMGYNYVSSTHS